ncbi:hypothetical protein HWC54_gp066 [Klebsiella phage Marfa]|uniref:Uncharacterized protein n=1 Tax=Klebsiella phage Marfa TaxID=2587809 RepID=A0A4Y5TST4_9CAUD|nr:hypothetical protein HWC54_gp066 [Klebsiella phage Marfa]QDB71721.1 hypothetical protein CPT_Marfa_066 [Klebsiella phage Marfa]
MKIRVFTTPFHYGTILLHYQWRYKMRTVEI